MNEGSDRPVRRFGPTGWAVLNILQNRSVAAEDGLVAHVTIRGLAIDLGLSKGTVQRALRRLSTAGLVEARQRRSSGGTFSAGHYVLTVNVTEPTQHDDPPDADNVDQQHAITSTAPTSAPGGQLNLGI